MLSQPAYGLKSNVLAAPNRPLTTSNMGPMLAGIQCNASFESKVTFFSHYICWLSNCWLRVANNTAIALWAHRLSVILATDNATSDAYTRTNTS